jgi:hypothetical protein
MHVKNGITVALQVLPIFPLVEDHGKELYKVMEVLEKRSDLTPDLKQGCKAYMVQLQKRTSVRPYVPQDGFSGVSPLHPRVPSFSTVTDYPGSETCGRSIWLSLGQGSTIGPGKGSQRSDPRSSGPCSFSYRQDCHHHEDAL